MRLHQAPVLWLLYCRAAILPCPYNNSLSVNHRHRTFCFDGLRKSSSALTVHSPRLQSVFPEAN